MRDRPRDYRLDRFGPLIVCAVALLMLASSTFGDGISRTGRITQFNSIVIDGVHYDTTNAIVRVNGRLSELAELRLGQQIIALVDEELLIALEVDQYDAVSGRIESLDVDDEMLADVEMRIVGQDVNVGLETVLHIDDLSKLKEGDDVTVGGLRDEHGTIHASALEAADKDDEIIISGLVSHIEDGAFRIGGATVTSPYLQEIAAETWFFEGAPVLIRANGKYEDGQLEAQEIIPVPEEMVRWGEDWEYTEARIDGEIQAYDPEQGTLTVSNLTLAIDEKSTMQDARDERRWFGRYDLYPGDQVSLAIEDNGRQLRVKKLVRFKKVKPKLRAPLKGIDVSGEVLGILNTRFDDISEADEIKFRGRKTKKVDATELGVLLEIDDGVEIEWKKNGEIKKLVGVPDCRKNLRQLFDQHGIDASDKDAVKALKESLKETNRRAYLCL